MIKLKLDVNAAYEIKPTIFPDGTSQVWKLDEFTLDQNPKFAKIEWYWEGNESELIWVNQLICLLYQLKIEIYELYIPYLPYARQDKEVSNTTTFAKQVFLEMLLKEHVGKITTLDAHSKHPAICNYDPHQIREAIDLFEPHAVVFPDAGAYNRYAHNLSAIPVIVIDKVRNQLTGKIEGLTLNKELSNFVVAEEYAEDGIDYKLLIVDDLCDGGMTYIKASEFLRQELFPQSNVEIGLYITHGIFSKGASVLFDSGINKIYTTDTLDAYRSRYNIDSSGVIIIK